MGLHLLLHRESRTQSAHLAGIGGQGHVPAQILLQASTKGARGFGLGLFVARSIAERHGGLLWAESEEGRGAVMMLELPAGGRAGNARESQTPSFRGGSSMPYSSSL